jgi:hypothetical protein
MPTISLILPQKSLGLTFQRNSGIRAVAYVTGPTGPSGEKGDGVELLSGQLPIIYNTGDYSISLDIAYVSGLINSGLNTGDFINNGQTGQFYPVSNPSGFITGVDTGNFYTYSNPLSFATSGDIYNTGFLLDQKINALSGNNYYLSSNPSGFINNLSGLSPQSIANATGVITTNLENTGQALYNQVNNLSGYSDFTFATKQSLQLTGQSSIIYSNSVANIISGDLTNTGISLNQKIDSLSGFALDISGNLKSEINGLISNGGITTGQADLRYYPLNNPSGFITGINTGNFVTRQETGQFATNNNLFQTGNTLDLKINSLSGNNYYASSNPSGFLNTLSGLSVSFVTGLSGQLNTKIENTGIYLNNLVSSLSGNSDTKFATKTELINSGNVLQDFFGVNNKSMYLGFDLSGTTTGIFYENGTIVELYRNISGSVTGMISNLGKLKIILRDNSNKITGVRYV